MATASCSGVILTDASGYPICEDGAGTPVTWQEQGAFDPADIDLTQAGEIFAIGFIMYGTAFAIGKAVGLILEQIKR
jgi:hypothetical protein